MAELMHTADSVYSAHWGEEVGGGGVGEGGGLENKEQLVNTWLCLQLRDYIRAAENKNTMYTNTNKQNMAMDKHGKMHAIVLFAHSAQ